MIITLETCWLSVEQILELLRAGKITVTSNDQAEVTLYVHYIDAVRAREIAESACD